MRAGGGRYHNQLRSIQASRGTNLDAATIAQTLATARVNTNYSVPDACQSAGERVRRDHSPAALSIRNAPKAIATFVSRSSG